MGFYAFGGTLTEQERLLAQAASQQPDALWLLDRLGVRSGWRDADVGCGPIGIPDLLAERVGAAGTVVGIEREPRFVDTARKLITERDLAPVQVIYADATATGLPNDTFDLVHARLVLLHQREPSRLIGEMLRVTRPGGWVAFQELDAATFFCDPPHPAWTRLWEAALVVCGQLGIDVDLGRRVHRLLREAGLEKVQAEAHTRIVRPGEYGRTHLLSIVTAMRTEIIDHGLLSEFELTDMMGAVMEHVCDPATLVMRELLVQTWGRKPS